MYKKNECCMICEGETVYYFSKRYDYYPTAPFEKYWDVDYNRCINCGFVHSVTHATESRSFWSDLNSSWHHYYEQNLAENPSNPPPYLDQAMALSVLDDHDLVNLSQAVDYAAGYGTMAKILRQYMGKNIRIFDEYVRDSYENDLYLDKSSLTKFELVVNSAMFEHVLNRADLDKVNSLVKPGGVLMVHSVICENVPCDPNWFYLTPITHTAFHTNRSMSILMGQWGYTHSVYCPKAKSWFMFSDATDYSNISVAIGEINTRLQNEYFLHSRGWLGYWKGF